MPIVASLEKLTESEHDALLHILEKMKIQRNSIAPRIKFLESHFILFSSIWFVALLAGGLLDVQPVWFRFMLLPLFGIPFAIFHVFEIVNYRRKKDLQEFVVLSFFIGPIIGFFWGLLLSIIIYYGWKFIS